MDDPFFSPESLLSPESLFGAVVEWRRTLLDQTTSEAFQALDAMRQVHPERERQNRRLFMSSVAEDMNVLAAGVVDYDSDSNLASVTPIRHLTPEEVETDRAHLEYLRAVTQEHVDEQEKNIPDNVRELSAARQRVDSLYGRQAA